MKMMMMMMMMMKLTSMMMMMMMMLIMSTFLSDIVCLLKLANVCFFNPRVDYLEYDLTSRGNYPAQSKFDLIKNQASSNHGILSCFSLDYVRSMRAFLLGLRSILNLYTPFNVVTIGKIFRKFNGHPTSSDYLTSAKRVPPLRQFLHHTTVVNQFF